MKEINISITDKLPKITSMTGTAVTDNTYRFVFEFDSEWQDGTKTVYIVNNFGKFVPYIMDENSVEITLTDARYVDVGISQGTLITSRPCRIVVDPSIKRIAGEEISPPEPGIYDQIMQKLNELEQSGATPEQIAEAIEQYLSENPITAADVNAVPQNQGEENAGKFLGINESGDVVPVESGADGITPHIGENGNWYIGETDTGIKAQGEKGSDGTTPHIGDNGNWFIGETDTGIKAQGEKGEKGETGEKGDPGDPGPEEVYVLGDGETVEDAPESAKVVFDPLETIANIGGTPTEPAENDIPKVFFTGTAPTTKAEDELPLEMDYRSKTLSFHDYVTLKVQGDSSAAYPKKNFNLKMFSDADRSEKDKRVFRDWSKTNKYCLKANWIDHTHARNVVNGRLWGQVVRSRADYESYPAEYRESANCGAVNGFPVKVYLNGVYQGLYTWNIRKDESMFNMDNATGYHAALIADKENDITAWRRLALIDGSDWTDELNDTVPEGVLASFRAAQTFVMESTDVEFKANIENHFYLSSLIDYWIFVFASLMAGGYWKSQTVFTYDGTKYLANIYDMDTTWALHWAGTSYYSYTADFPDDFIGQGDSTTRNLLYERLLANYTPEIKARYWELRKSVLTDANIIDAFERFTDVIGTDLYAEDFASTTAGGKFTEIPSKDTNNIQRLREIIATRMEFVDERIETLSVPVECTGITLSADSLTFTGAGTQTLTATVTPDNCTQSVTWVSDDTGVVTVTDGVVNAVGDGTATITATCGNYSATCSVSVSGIDVSGAVYILAEPTTLDGTNDYIDTGILLSDTPKDFTILMDADVSATMAETPSEQKVLLHCMETVSPYNGIVLQIASSINLAFSGNGLTATTIAKVPTNHIKFAITAEQGTNVKIYANVDGTVTEYSVSGTIGTCTQTLLIGQRRNNSIPRRWAGTINAASVYDRVLTGDEITAFVGAVNQQ